MELGDLSVGYKLKKLKINEMNNSEKISHLENILIRLENLNITESSIKELSLLIRTEYRNELTSENTSKVYSNNLKQTIEKNLEDLEANINKPKLRIELFNDCISNFKQDVDRELTDLKYR